jgi:hypothetical protein
VLIPGTDSNQIASAGITLTGGEIVFWNQVSWTLALSDGRCSCIHPRKADLFALEKDAIHRSSGHSGALEADCEARVPG